MRLISQNNFIFKFISLLLIGLFFIFSFNILAAKSTKNDTLEEKWSKLLKAESLKKELVTLKSGSKSFIALYRKQTSGNPQGGIILLHGRGTHPDWQTIIRPIRKALPKYGWSTLSIQLPVLDNEKKLIDHVKLFDPSVERINAAISYLKSQNIRNIAIIGYELGATIGAYSLTKIKGDGIKAYVGISMLSTRKNRTLDTSLSLALVKTPVFDIYASNDTDDVLAATVERTSLIYQHRRLQPQGRDPKSVRYRQWQVDGAGPKYLSYENHLVKRIRSWLRVFAPGKIIKTKQTEAKKTN